MTCTSFGEDCSQSVIQFPFNFFNISLAIQLGKDYEPHKGTDMYMYVYMHVHCHGNREYMVPTIGVNCTAGVKFSSQLIKLSIIYKEVWLQHIVNSNKYGNKKTW